MLIIETEPSQDYFSVHQDTENKSKENNPFSNLKSQLQSLRSSQTNFFNASPQEDENYTKITSKLDQNISLENETKQEINSSSFFKKNVLAPPTEITNQPNMFSQIVKNPVSDSQYHVLRTKNEGFQGNNEMSFGFNEFVIDSSRKIDSYFKENYSENEMKFQPPQVKKSKFLIKQTAGKDESILIPVIESKRKLSNTKENIIDEKQKDKINSTSNFKTRPQQFVKRQTPYLSVLESIAWKRVLQTYGTEYEYFKESIQKSEYQLLPEPFCSCNVGRILSVAQHTNKVSHIFLMIKSVEIHKDTVTLKLMVNE